MLDRAKVIDTQFMERVANAAFPTARTVLSLTAAGLSPELLLTLFDAQLIARHLDLQARILKEQNRGFYTIGSSGHEGNAAIAAAFRATDMAFLHYRSSAFMVQRSRATPDCDPIYDHLLSLMASAEDPCAGGRHKVFGSLPLLVPPQTSTIASHLPKAVGTALSITRAKELKLKARLAEDSVVLCSFGDASVNHSTAQGAFNAARWISYQPYPLPLVFICEDNHFGISVATPEHWIADCFAEDPVLHYIPADGLHIADVYRAAKQAETIARQQRKPVFLHMKTVRLLGHAGSDIELQYRTAAAIEQAESQDPLLHTARILVEQHLLTPKQIVDRYQAIREQVQARAAQAATRPRLASAAAVTASLIPPVQAQSGMVSVTELQRQQVFGEAYAQLTLPRHLAQQINLALTDLLLQYPAAVVFGEDVGKKGGVYRVTADLQQRFGQRRVFDTLLDEQTILGTAIGMAHNGFIPIPEIQFLAYVHNAADQIRGEAATLSFFSNGQYTNPMVIRIAGLAYQKGFGGHFHNDNSIAALRDIPGVIIACPARGNDAAKMLRTCLQLAAEEQRVVIFLEPIALYMTKDLHQPGDNLWLSHYPAPQEKMAYGEIGEVGQSDDLAIISYGNGFYLSSQAQPLIEKAHQCAVKLIDIRWLAPLNLEAIVNAVRGCRCVLIVDEGRQSGSLSEALITGLVEHLSPLPRLKRVTGEDSFIPLGTAWQYVLPSRDDIVQAASELLQQS